MAWDDPVVWVLIVGAIILLFGSNKIPELARSLGAAKKEFDEARKGFVGALNSEINNPGTPGLTPPSQPPGLRNPRSINSPALSPQVSALPGSNPTDQKDDEPSQQRNLSASQEEDDPLLVAARNEGIDTRGKTRSQIASELAAKVKD